MVRLVNRPNAWLAGSAEKLPEPEEIIDGAGVEVGAREGATVVDAVREARLNVVDAVGDIVEVIVWNRKKKCGR